MAYETLHYMKNKMKCRTSHMALKLCTSKSYDQLEWAYLKRIMEKQGLHAKWVSLVLYPIIYRK